MMEWIKQALSEGDGQPSSSRLATFILVALAVVGYMLAMFIILHVYFTTGTIPTGDSILVYCLGGSTGSAISGASVYFANQYGNRDVPMQPVMDAEDSLNQETNEH